MFIRFFIGPVTCPTCERVFDRQSRLDKHQQGSQAGNSCNECEKIFCYPAHLHQHILTQHTGNSINTNTLDNVIYPQTGYEHTNEYKNKLTEHMTVIRTKTTNGRDWKTINLQITPDFTYRDLKTLLNKVRRDEHGVFKINVGFGSMLYDTVNKIYRYYYVSSNHFLFDRAYMISSNSDMTDFFNKILSLDLSEKYYFQRPSSGWILAGLPNIEIRIMRIRGVPIGAGIQLPAYITKSRSIIGLTKCHIHSFYFTDNLCFFRCLALHFGTSLRALEIPTKHLKTRLEAATGKSYQNGVEVSMLSDIEIFFQIGINVYSLAEDNTANVVRISNLDYKSVMHLNLFENHFSYISKFKSYAKKFQCPNCSRIISKSCNLQRHVKECQTEVEEVFTGGKYRNKKTVFELLDTLNIHVPDADRFDPYFAVYDFEALQVPIDDELQGRTLHYKHVPATVSICTNIPGHTNALHLRSTGDPQQLVDTFVEELLKVQAVRERLLTEKYQSVIDDLNVQQLECKTNLGEVDQSMEVEDVESDSEDEIEVQHESRKRKRKQSKKTSKRSTFLDDEAQLSGDDSGDDDSDNDTDIDGLIDDSSDLEENEASFYRNIDNNVRDESQPGPSTLTLTLTYEQKEVERKRLKKLKTFHSKLLTYIKQITVLGFNSQKYDIPLIRPYLPSAIIKHDSLPRQVIKKQNGYMTIASMKLKFLDITNYLAAGTSLKNFYESYSVSTPKGVFPYAWFDSLDKLDATSLPNDIEIFRSILTKKRSHRKNLNRVVSCGGRKV